MKIQQVKLNFLLVMQAATKFELRIVMVLVWQRLEVRRCLDHGASGRPRRRCTAFCPTELGQYKALLA